MPVQIFKTTAGYVCETFVYHNQQMTHIGNGFGGFGVTSIVPFDVNSDGNMDIVYAYSFGSGIHRSIISWCDFVILKEYTVNENGGSNDFRMYVLILRIEDKQVNVYKIEAENADPDCLF